MLPIAKKHEKKIIKFFLLKQKKKKKKRYRAKLNPPKMLGYWVLVAGS